MLDLVVVMPTAERPDPMPPARPPLRGVVAEPLAFSRPSPRLPLDTMITAAPKEDGHAVLVLPALLCSDRYTRTPRGFISSLGYSAHGWRLGVNLGPTRRLLDGAMNRLTKLANIHGPVSIVGFSMGGLFARLLGARRPDLVRQVITVCSPIHQPAENFWLPLEHFPGTWRGVDLEALTAEAAQKLAVPVTALFSRDDGLVNGAACRDMHAPPLTMSKSAARTC
jgi:pimeloyl-ACP methyl ester carboxylesterase